jgi:hypothetical protein
LGVWWNVFGPRVAFLIGSATALLATIGLLAFRILGGPESPDAERS